MPIEKREHEQRTKDKRPAQLQRSHRVKTGIKSNPHFGRKYFYLEDSWNGEVVQGENEGQDASLAESSF